MTTRSLEVTRRLRDGILDGTYPGGTRMNEIDLAAALGVSRTPIRGALATLGAEGLLDYTPNSGYVVRRYTAADIADIYEVRGNLVGLAARRAAERGLSDEARGAIHRILDDCARLVRSGDWSDAVRAEWEPLNRQFHFTIQEAAGNPFLVEMIRRAAELPLLGHIRHQWYDAAEMVRAHDEHLEIADAIFHRQPLRAEALATEHVYRMGRRLARQWQRVEERRMAEAAADDAA